MNQAAPTDDGVVSDRRGSKKVDRELGGRHAPTGWRAGQNRTAQREGYRALSHRCNPMSGPAAEVATDSGVAPAARRCRQGAGDARATYEYLGKMLVASLERLEQLVTRESES